METTKYCLVCETHKDVGEFYPRFTTENGRCKQCERERQRRKYASDPVKYRKISKAWRDKNPDRERRREAARFYGLTLQQHEDLIKEQQNLCAICSSPPSVKSLCIDHNHQTGKVRGLLCDRCNRHLGGFKDDVELLKKSN